MEGNLTNNDITRIADRVMLIIRDEVKDNDNLAEIVLLELEKRIEFKRKLRNAGPVED